MSFTIYLTRHGQTILNKYRRFQGWCDAPLTDQGIEDAKKAGQRLKDVQFNFAYSSDSPRAIQTRDMIIAENQFKAPETHELPNFREQSFGYFEGADSGHIWTMVGLPHGCKTYYEILDNLGAAATRDLLHEADPWGDAEDDQTYWNRIAAGFEYLKEHHGNGETLLLVSHSLTIRTIVDHFAPEYNATVNGPKNGSVTKLVVDNHGKISVEYYNHY